MERLSRIGWMAIGALVLLVGSVIVYSQNQEGISQTQLIGLRLDIETLADRAFGGGTRPEMWTGNADTDTPNILADLWFDNELVADAVFGSGIRPDDWTGAASANPVVVARNVRHDVEISADNLIGEGLRPDSWVGATDPLALCDRNLMNLAYMLQSAYGVEFVTDPAVSNYCGALRQEIQSDYLEGRNTGSPSDAEIDEMNLAVRGDLERLADELLGLNTRPQGWMGNKDINSPTLLTDNLNDLILLSDDILGPSNRPDEFYASISTSDLSAVRNLRHDLEVLADVTLGVGVRPRGWQGVELPLARCNTDLQGLVQLVDFVYGFELPISDAMGSAYCNEVYIAASFSAQNPPAEEDVAQAIDQRYVAESRNAFAYLDLAATQYMGPVPWGTEIRAWYRNYSDSTMMFVSGDDFAVYLDRRWTTLSEETFMSLPSMEGVQPLTFCDATWCNGPAPTPTPTGSGPLLQIITGATPPATIAPDQVVQGGKEQVGWNNVRVNYIEQFPDRGVAQVTLDICSDSTQIDCEPVTRVFDNSTGFEVAPIGVANDHNIYELPYGYSQNLLIEGATLFSTDVWLNDPTLS
ncbi:hypothetical protein G4Y79_22080 [Phototrophicus methaneseepsis]|uniref:Uncharacterized protein n=1 Tax=Phototrophicus methaneseepsis TaxID=2710758 RepID=A0A7S8E8J5_9CHLR|nr:hypothetical protein [Phototrophicus methaneseepsis]QPC82341.1 hypothetical protein G4Y79_22080 [Phototrophicus methaneseepsis]